MNEPELLRIRQIRVDGLFGLYNHTINLNQEERVTVLHGPNGVGKTITLKMVHALLEGQFGILGEMPFSRFVLVFSDDTEVEVAPTQFEGSIDKLWSEKTGHQKTLKISLRNGEKSYSYTIAETFYERDGKELEADEVIARYSKKRMLFNITRRHRFKEPSWLSNLREKVNTYLIETQRLFKVQEAKSAQHLLNSKMIATVEDYAQDIKQRIRETLARYGQQSQLLDQSFPQRLLTVKDTPLAASELKQRMRDLDEKRSELKKIGLLDDSESVEHPFNPEQLDNLDFTQQRVMTLYVQDTEKKLGVFESLAHPARLFLDNVNKFQHKRLRLDRERGFVVEDENHLPLNINLLSSGEQHELVLHYDLLFRVRPNTLVLIDEPELSLHVAWQKRFLPDLLEIVKVAQIDALVATHSPFIVGDRSDLMVPLEAELVNVST
jgi:predicted ATP-binding protein involved in virulence